MYIALMTVVLTTVFLTHAVVLKQTVYGDGRYYYSWLRSIVFDHDIDFGNEYRYFGIDEPRVGHGLLRNVYAIGPAIFWSQGFFIAKALFGGNGYSLPYQLAAGVSGVAIFLSGLVLLYTAISRYFHLRTAMLAIIAATFATNALFYGSIDTVNSHAVSFFLSAALLYSLTSADGKSPVVWGVLTGLLAVNRIQDMIIGLAAVPFILQQTKTSDRYRQVWESSSRFVFSAMITFMPQLMLWGMLYGMFFVIPYSTMGYTFSFFRPRILEVLFSTRNGLFLWTPLMALGVIGSVFRRRIPRRLVLSTITVFILQLWTVGSWEVWWQGASYSGRMFVSIIPFLTPGFAELIDRITAATGTYKTAVTILAIFIALNCASILYFLIQS